MALKAPKDCAKELDLIPRALRSSLGKGLGTAWAGTERVRGGSSGRVGAGVTETEFSRLVMTWTWG